LAIEEYEPPPAGSSERGGSGRFGARTLVQAVWDFDSDGPNFTAVRLNFETNPVGRGGRDEGALRAARLWHKRQYKVALERLRIIFEGAARGGGSPRATIAALRAPHGAALRADPL